MDAQAPLDAQLVLQKLKELHKELGELIRAAEDAASLKQPELSMWKARFAAAKRTIKLLASTETIDGTKRQLNHFECAFFAPSIKAAASNFRLHVDAQPDKWADGLSLPMSNLDHYIRKLESHLGKDA